MPKGKIASITPDKWNDKDFWKFKIEGDNTLFSCFSPGMGSKKVGDEVDFTVKADNRGEMTRATLVGDQKGGGGRGKSPEEIELEKLRLYSSATTMCISYAKDKLVADKVTDAEYFNRIGPLVGANMKVYAAYMAKFVESRKSK